MIDRFVFGSTHRSIRLRQSNRTAKVRLRFIRRTFTCAEPNAYFTYKLYLSQRSARSIDLACSKDFILNKMAGKEECASSSCLATTKYTCLRCERFKKKEYIFDVYTNFTNRNFPIQDISKAKRQDFSEQNLQKQHLKKTLLYSNRDYATEVTSTTL